MPREPERSIHAPAGHLPGIPDTIPGHFDRALSELNRTNEFKAVQTRFRNKKSGRTIMVIEADVEDAYRYFVFRVANYFWSKKRDLGILDWPGDDLDELLERLTVLLSGAVSPKAARQSDLGKRLAVQIQRPGGSVIFSHRVNWDGLQRDGAEALERWFKFFAEECPAPRDGHLLAVLAIHPPGEPQRISPALAKLKTRYGETVHHVERLSKIAAVDLENWADKLIHPPFGGLAFVLRGLATKVFPTERTTTTFSVLRERIIEEAEKMKPQTTFSQRPEARAR